MEPRIAIFITMLMGIFIIIILAACNNKNIENTHTRFIIYLPETGYKKLEYFSTDEFEENGVYYNLNDFTNYLKKKYNSDKIDIIKYKTYINKTGI